ncbi:MAG: DNA-directed RNA polymerase subunit omega [Enterocloster sp.]
MLHPSGTDPIEAVNSGVEPGEQPHPSCYSTVIAAAKRARRRADPLAAGAVRKKPPSTAAGIT